MIKKLETIWLWIVAVSIAVVMTCSAIAWVGGIALFIMRWFND